MTSHDPHDHQLQDLLTQAVDDVEPADRLEEIRARLDQRPSRSRWYAVGAAAAVAAVVVAAVWVGDVLPDGDHRSDVSPAGHGDSNGDPTPSTPASPSASPTESPGTVTTTTTTASAPAADGESYAVYCVGDSPRGRPVLFREFRLAPQGNPLDVALEGLSDRPLDPDYRTDWAAGDLADVSFDGVGDQGRLSVRIRDASLLQRPAGMSAAEAEASVQQVVYTLEAAAQTTAPVQFYLGDQPAPTVLGVPTSQPLTRGSALETLSLMNISSPDEGATVSGDIEVTGLNNGFEASVFVYLLRDGRRYLPTAGMGGWTEDRLFPWKVSLDLSKVPPGHYTLVAQNDDPTGKNLPETDTKEIDVVR